VLGAFERGGIFIVPHLLWHGTSVFPVKKIIRMTDPFSCLSLHAWGCGGPILIRILTGKSRFGNKIIISCLILGKYQLLS
jgi:hypothetical protein